MSKGRSTRAALAVVLLSVSVLAAQPQEVYRQPSPEIVRILDHPPAPFVSMSPDRRWMLLVHRDSMPSIAEVASPMLRLAGMRIDPSTNGPVSARRSLVNGFTLQELSGGDESEDESLPKLDLPENSRWTFPSWSPDSRLLFFGRISSPGMELWVADVQNQSARRLTDRYLNAASGTPCQWASDSRSLLCRFIPSSRGSAPRRESAPSGPAIKVSRKGNSQVRTYQDLLRDSHDESLYEYYLTSRVAWVDVGKGGVKPIGRAGIYGRLTISPSGKFILAERTVRPFSRMVTQGRFPKKVDIWDRAGRTIREFTHLPLAEAIPIRGVRTGPRGYRWRNDKPHMLVWTEALDGGDPRNKVEFRDRILLLDAPFDSEPKEMFRTEFRTGGVQWGDGFALVSERDFKKQWTRTWLVEESAQGKRPRRPLWELSSNDAYNDPGRAVANPDSKGQMLVVREGDWILLRGRGASPKGDHPFLSRFNLKTGEKEVLFRSKEGVYESVSQVLDASGRKLITRLESPTNPPNYLLRDLSAHQSRALTYFTDPSPQLRKVKKQLITYQRQDGIELSGTLYLPADYRAGQRLPVVMWAYPREFNDRRTAGQVRGSANRFTYFRGPSHLFFLTQGYAVLDGPGMPIVGEQGNDSFVQQLAWNAQAAIDKLVEMGVADPDRIGIGGHSYGAFMTANLLAHTDLFRAGIARSGAYNRTLTPFGFQNERRTYWDASDVYYSMSPFMHADKLDEPILLIHGAADNNSGTFPVQSERMFHALNGLGGTVRLVMLPHESHGYSARESVLHSLAEMIDWFEINVKGAARREIPAEIDSRSEGN